VAVYVAQTKAEKEAQAEEEKVQKRKSWLCPGCGNR
jgi:TPP-dependent indolepyruvate ferredoxin oxidoreductase alpha subunit